MINMIKDTMRRPVGCLTVIFATGYFIFIGFQLSMYVGRFHLESNEGYFALLALVTIYIVLTSLACHAREKGLIFQTGQIQFVFPSPVSPKLILLQSAFFNCLMSFFLWGILLLIGVFIFWISPGRILLLVGFGLGLELVMELSLVVIMYGNDRISEKTRKIGAGIIWGLMGLFTLGVAAYFYRMGVSPESVRHFFGLPVLRMTPVIGWMLCSFHLLLFGPGILDVAGTVLYVAWVGFVLICARRVKCEGGYFEKAAEFAIAYRKARNRKKNGEMVFSLNHDKRTLRRSAGRLNGRGAQAIFYRQLVEYRKERFFVFDQLTLMMVLLAAFIGFVIYKGALEHREAMSMFYRALFLFAITVYVNFISSASNGKIDDEIKKPYIYMIPDGNLKKMFFSTLMEHIRALLHACLLVIPVGVLMKVEAGYTAAVFVLFVLFRGINLYLSLTADMIIGNALGGAVRRVIKMILLSLIITVGAVVSAPLCMFIGVNMLFPILLIYSIIILLVVFGVASTRFKGMEQLS